MKETMIASIALTLVTGGYAVWLAFVTAGRHHRSPTRWAATTAVVGLSMLVVDRWVWVRPEGQSASLGPFDMQMLLPTFAMLGTVFLITQLPPGRLAQTNSTGDAEPPSSDDSA